MNTFKNLVLVTLAFSAIVLAISLNSAGHAIAQAVNDVRVVNRANQPVQARIVNVPADPVIARIVNATADPVITKTGIINGPNHPIPIVGSVEISNFPQSNTMTSRFVVGTTYNLTPVLGSGINCTVRGSQGSWLKCELAGAQTLWVNATNIISSDK